jgi:hypothetical protein
MGARGTFDIPTTPSQSTRGIRRAYRIAFGCDSAASDDDIRDCMKNFVKHAHPFPRCNDAIIALREYAGDADEAPNKIN